MSRAWRPALAAAITIAGCSNSATTTTATGTTATSTGTTSATSTTSAASTTSTTGEGTGGGAGGSATTGTGGSVCAAPVDKPHDPAKAEWSYHGADDGPVEWGALTGDAACGAGMSQTPIDIVDGATVVSTKDLAFANYDKAIPFDLLDNGHALQINYAGTMSAGDPQISYDGKTYYLAQLHWHSASEHAVNSAWQLFEVHFVHKAADGALAVVGVLFKSGPDNAVLARMMKRDPGHAKEVSCADTVTPESLLPASRGFYHYSGSLTTPPCSEGLDWFVMTDPLEASAKQQNAYQTGFSGSTNRPLQPLDGRIVEKHAP
jgi:carbonic anhydrase